jgi:hypothetical protein
MTKKDRLMLIIDHHNKIKQEREQRRSEWREEVAEMQKQEDQE